MIPVLCHEVEQAFDAKNTATSDVGARIFTLEAYWLPLGTLVVLCWSFLREVSSPQVLDQALTWGIWPNVPRYPDRTWLNLAWKPRICPSKMTDLTSRCVRRIFCLLQVKQSTSFWHFERWRIYGCLQATMKLGFVHQEIDWELVVTRSMGSSTN